MLGVNPSVAGSGEVEEISGDRPGRAGWQGRLSSTWSSSCLPINTEMFQSSNPKCGQTGVDQLNSSSVEDRKCQGPSSAGTLISAASLGERSQNLLPPVWREWGVESTDGQPWNKRPVPEFRQSPATSHGLAASSGRETAAETKEDDPWGVPKDSNSESPVRQEHRCAVSTAARSAKEAGLFKLQKEEGVSLGSVHTLTAKSKGLCSVCGDRTAGLLLPWRSSGAQ